MERTELLELLAIFGFDPEPNSGNGDCLYKALAHACDTLTWEEVRQICALHLQSTPEETEAVEVLNTLVQGEWGGAQQIAAFATSQNKKITVFYIDEKKDSHYIHFNEEGAEHIFLLLHAGHYEFLKAIDGVYVGM